MRGRFVKAAPVIAACLVAGAIGGVKTLSASTTAGSVSTGAIRIGSGAASSGADLSHYQYIVLNAWDYGMIPALKRANPQVRVLVYKDMSSTRSYASGDAEIPTGIDYGWANANHPDWFTHKSGTRIEWSGYSGHWQMNIGMAGYQNQWATNVTSDLAAHGWDGVMIDNANMNPNGYASLPYDEYSTRQSYQDATRSFLANVGPKLQSAGFLVIPNIQHDGAYLTEALWTDWIQFTSGGFLEHYSKWGEDASGWLNGSGWTFEQNLQRDAAGKIFLGLFYSPVSDVRSMRYARASFLLDWDGGPSAVVFEPSSGADPWSPEWTADIGTPVGSRYQVGSAYRRDYTGGTVVVNPSSNDSQQVDLGDTYLMPDSSSVTSVTLAAMTGLVLRSPATTPTTTTATP